MCSVPRLWEKVYAKDMDGISKAPEKKQKIFKWAGYWGQYLILKER
jgi:long-subunit acyl-CoA synthetase (AMP-forming)